MKFDKKRRKQFLTEGAYFASIKFFEEDSSRCYLDALSRPHFDAADRARNANAYADERFMDFMLKYTAGEPFALLRQELDQVISAYEQAAKYIRESQKSATFPPLRFIEIDEYERILQMIGLCFLLHRRELLPRITAIFDPSSADADTLYEDLLAFEFEGRFDSDSWYHDAPYRDLINSIYRETDEESIADIERYLKNWYKSLVKAPWHNSHLQMDEESCAGYFGYWAMEAGAVAYLLNLDDTRFRDHLVYPKDLVDFAREMDQLSKKKQPTSANQPDRVEGGLPCPKAGYWMTPAEPDSRRYFNVGEIMPTIVNSSYGATIWQCSDDRNS